MNEKILLIYFAIITAVTSFVTVYDKIAAKKLPKNRVPEKTLFLLAFFGGSVGEYVTMQLIRHKTKHKSFMVGLPLIIILQIMLIIAYYLYKEGIISA